MRRQALQERNGASVRATGHGYADRDPLGGFPDEMAYRVRIARGCLRPAGAEQTVIGLVS